MFLLLVCGTADGQERSYSVTAYGAFTTSAKLFPYPNDPDDFTRGQFLPLDDIFSSGIEIRRELRSIRLQIGLGVEYIAASTVMNVPSTQTTIEVRDGFRVFPIEGTAYFVIPFSGDLFQLFMGAGGGVYPGIRSYTYADANSSLADRTTGVGIHIVSGVEYSLGETFSLRAILKFRDVQFESVNKFNQSTTLYHGTGVTLSQNALSSRINIDGMVASIGLAYHF